MSKELDDKVFDLETKEFSHLREAQRLREERLRMELDDADMRDLTYEPPFSGSRPQTLENVKAIHRHWIEWLTEDPPYALPLEENGWPKTWGLYDPENGASHGEGGDKARCLQCGGCQFYVPLEGSLGADWGACANEASEYEQMCVFEHFTCRAFTP